MCKMIGKIFLSIWAAIQSVRQRIFAGWFPRLSENVLNPMAVPAKKELFKTLTERPGKGLKILEIGIGCGTNLDYYPAGADLIALDPNPHWKRPADDRLAKFNSVEQIVAFAQDMPTVPDNSIDAVVSTYVLCNVPHKENVLREVSRVLKPGTGRYYFFDHVTYDGKRRPFARWCQKWLATPLSKLLFDCYFLKPTSWAIEGSAGSGQHALKLEWFKYTEDVVSKDIGWFDYLFVWWPIIPHDYGVAVKTS